MKNPRLFLFVLVAFTGTGSAVLMSQVASSADSESQTEVQPKPAVATQAVPTASASRESQPRLRVGTFDSRFVALAHYRSELGMQAVRSLQDEFEAATKPKDKDRLRALESKGAALQNLMHQQVFGNLSIPNVLETVG